MKAQIDFAMLVSFVLATVFFLGLGLGFALWGNKHFVETFENCTTKEVRINDCWADGRYEKCFQNATVCETFVVYRK